MKYLTLFLLLALSTCLWADEHDVPAPFDYGRVRIPPGTGGGVDEFTDLIDTPGSYSGQTGKVVKVNAGENGLEFATESGGGTMTHAEIEDSLNAAVVEPSQNWYWQSGDSIFFVSATNDTVGMTINADGELETFPKGTAKADSLLVNKWIQIVNSDIEISKDVSNNLTLKDVPTGIKTLAQLAIDNGNDITVEDEGTPFTTAVTKLNFAGAGVTATEPIADEILVTIPGGGGSGFGYTLPFTCMSWSTLSDGQTVYFGSSGTSPNTNAVRNNVYIPKAGTITSAFLFWYAGTEGTNENISLYVRKNHSSDELVQTVGTNTRSKKFSNVSMTTTVVQGDSLQMKFVLPTWATNPANVTLGGCVYIE